MVALRLRAHLRRAWRPLLGLALLVALAAGSTTLLASGARRTASVADRLVARFGGDPDLMFSSPQGAIDSDRLATVPGLDRAEFITFVAVAPVLPDGTIAPEANPFAVSDQLGVVVEGRRAQAREEVMVSREFARRYSVGPGDSLQLLAYTQAQADANAYDDEPAGPHFEVRVVGVLRIPGDVDAPTPDVYLTRGVVNEHGPEVGEVLTLGWLYLDPGVEPDAVVDAVGRLPGGDQVEFDDQGTIVSDATRRAIEVQATALWVLAAAVALTAAVIVGPAVRRAVRVDPAERAILEALGTGSSTIRLEQAARTAAVGMVGGAIGVIGAYLLSGRFPMGFTRGLEPDPGMCVDLPVLVAGFVATTGLLLAVGAFRRASGEARRRRPARATVGDRAADLGLGLPGVVGLRFAFTRAASRAGGFAGICIGLACVAGATAFTTNLDEILDDPARYAADYELLIGNPWNPSPPEFFDAIVADDSFSAVVVGTTALLPVDGVNTGILGVRQARGSLLPALLSGRLPAGPDEIALGRSLAERLDVGVGDEVAVGAASGPLVVVGIAVVPEVVDLARGLGHGALMDLDGLIELDAGSSPTVALVTLADGVDALAAAARYGIDTAVPAEVGAVRPVDIQALDRVREVPFLFGVFSGLLALTTLLHTLVSAGRDRRRDLSVLRMLGARRRTLVTIMVVLGMSLTTAALAIALPVGLGVGRFAAGGLVERLGVVPGLETPWFLLSALVSVTVALAGLVGMPAGRAASRQAALSARRAE